MRCALLAALPLWVLAACVTTNSGDRDVNLKEAAAYNIELGAEYMRQGNLQIAKDKLDKAEKQDPKNARVYWTQALLFEELKQPAEAERSYQKARNLLPGASELENTYASFLCKKGDVEHALPMYDKVIADKLYPQPYVAATNAAVCLRGAQRNADAQRYLERALALGPGYASAVVELADLQIVAGDAEAARKTVEKFLTAGNKSADVYVVGVRANVVLHDCTTAQLYARLLRREWPSSPQAATLPRALSICDTAGDR